MTTLYNFLLELQSFWDISEDDLEKAKTSNITNTNNTTFYNIIKEYQSGYYDNDAPILVQRVLALL